MKLISKCLFISMVGLSTAAFADDKFVLINNTNQDLTAKLNGTCSTDTPLGPNGVTRKGAPPRDLPVIMAKSFCAGNTSRCPVEIYASENCNVNKIASFAIDVGSNIFVPAKGVVPGTVDYDKSNYSAKIEGFRLELIGGPSNN